MRIRSAEPNDVEKISELNNLFHLVGVPDFVWDQPVWVAMHIESYFLIEFEEQSIGAISLISDKVVDPENGDSKTLIIETLAVDQTKQRTGVGSKLIAFAKKYAKDNSFNKIVVESFAEYGLKEFYEKVGFTTNSEKGMYLGNEYYKFEMILSE